MWLLSGIKCSSRARFGGWWWMVTVRAQYREHEGFKVFKIVWLLLNNLQKEWQYQIPKFPAQVVVWTPGFCDYHAQRMSYLLVMRCSIRKLYSVIDAKFTPSSRLSCHIPWLLIIGKKFSYTLYSQIAFRCPLQYQNWDYKAYDHI